MHLLSRAVQATTRAICESCRLNRVEHSQLTLVVSPAFPIRSSTTRPSSHASHLTFRTSSRGRLPQPTCVVRKTSSVPVKRRREGRGQRGGAQRARRRGAVSGGNRWAKMRRRACLGRGRRRTALRPGRKSRLRSERRRLSRASISTRRISSAKSAALRQAQRA